MAPPVSPQRLAVKLFAHPDPGPGLELSPYIGLFHRFIQEKALEGLLIDVADYAHVPDGPGILLVGHEVDYGIDLAGGRPGLLTLRKRTAGLAPAELLRDTLRKALVALRAIEASELKLLRFATDRLQIQLVDRLVAPNDDAGFERYRQAFEPVLRELYGQVAVEIARDHADDPRRHLALGLRAAEAVPVAALLERLGAPAAAGPAPLREDELQSPWDIPVEELKRLRDSGADFVLLDVREPHEFEICNLGGMLIPLGSLPQRVSELDPGAHLVVHCRTGGRSAKAVELLRGAGFANAWNVNGGILAWIDRVDPSLTPY